LRIKIVTISYFPDRIGIAAIADDLSAGLAERGHEVTVIAGLPHYPSWEVPAEYRRHPFRREMRHGTVSVWRSWLYASKRPTVLARSAFYGSFTASASINLLRSGPADVVLVISPPPTVNFAASLFRRWRGARIVLNVQDIVPDAPIAFGMMRNPLQIRLFRWLERYAYASSDSIVVVAESFKDNLKAKGVPDAKLHVIHNWIDTDKVRPTDRMNPFRVENGLSADDFVVMYAGNIGLSQGLEVVIEAAEQFRSRPEIKFVFVGGGASLASLQASAESKGLTNVRFVPTQPDMRWVQGASDVSLVMQKPNVLDVNLPSKIPAIMASGKPMIAGLNLAGDAARIVREANCGILVEPGNPDQLAEAIDNMALSPSLRERCGSNGRMYAVGHFSRDVALDAYEVALAIQPVRQHSISLS